MPLTCLIVADAEADATASPDRPKLLVELEAQLRSLAAVSEDSYQFVVGLTLDVATALLDVHERRAAA